MKLRNLTIFTFIASALFVSSSLYASHGTHDGRSNIQITPRFAELPEGEENWLGLRDIFENDDIEAQDNEERLVTATASPGFTEFVGGERNWLELQDRVEHTLERFLTGNTRNPNIGLDNQINVFVHHVYEGTLDERTDDPVVSLLLCKSHNDEVINIPNATSLYSYIRQINREAIERITRENLFEYIITVGSSGCSYMLANGRDLGLRISNHLEGISRYFIVPLGENQNTIPKITESFRAAAAIDRLHFNDAIGLASGFMYLRTAHLYQDGEIPRIAFEIQKVPLEVLRAIPEEVLRGALSLLTPETNNGT